MFLHAVHASSHRSTRVKIKSNDSEIVIFGTALFPQLDLEELYVAFGAIRQAKLGHTSEYRWGHSGAIVGP